MELKFKIKGLDCANCAEELARALIKVNGIEDATINFITEKLIVKTERTDKNELINEIKKVIKKEEPDAELEEK